MTKRGLVIFVGATGTEIHVLAAMVDHQSQFEGPHHHDEDPIEFVHQHKGCIVTQREVGVDTESFGVALKNTLRQAPDVIPRRVRSKETMDYTLQLRKPVTSRCARCTRTTPTRHSTASSTSSRPTGRADLDGPLAEPEGDHRSATGADEGRLRTPRGDRDPGQYTAHLDTIRKGGARTKSMMTDAAADGMQTFDQALYRPPGRDRLRRRDLLG